MKIDLSALGDWVLLKLLLLALSSQAILAQSIPAGGSSDPFRIDGKAPTAGVIWIGQAHTQNSDIAESPMLCKLAGIAGELDARSLNKLRRSLGMLSSLGEGHRVIGSLSLSRTGSSKELVLARDINGSLAVLSETDPDQGWVIDPEVYEFLKLDQALLQGIEQGNPHSAVGTGRFNSAYFDSPVVLDFKTRRSRIKHIFPDLARVLDDESMRLRLPRNTDTDTLPGILVWVSPTPNGQIPRIFHDACDELNLIAVGVDNNGNPRSLTDRLQVHLDSITTVQAHFRTDPRRVYITGMSGGGRCSSILQLAFPDVFMGAVPIVGMDTYHRAPTGKPNEYWPERFAKPAARLFRLLANRRIAAITGSMDFNAPEMKTRTQQLKDDKINIRLDIIDGMGHTMPSSEQFADALVWVDELQQTRIEQASSKAQRSLDGYLKRLGSGPAEDAKSRKILIQITIDAPWSDAAWEAARLLGIEE